MIVKVLALWVRYSRKFVAGDAKNSYPTFTNFNLAVHFTLHDHLYFIKLLGA